MALSRADHKRISLSIAQEFRKVLGDANGRRLLDRHLARKAPQHTEPPGEAPDPEGLDDMMEEMAGEQDPLSSTKPPPFKKGKRPRV